MEGKNYRKILIELFQTYNPDKVKEVDSLLRKFSGREEELVKKIHQKYGGAALGAPRRKRYARILFFILLAGILATVGWYATKEGWGSEKEHKIGNLVDEDSLVTEVAEISAQETFGDSREPERIDLPTSELPMEYGVQIGLFSSAENREVLNQLGDRQLELNVLPTEAGKYMYVVGNDLELEAARVRRDEIRKNGFPDAFVVGLKKGKRVLLLEE